ncbi:hypothetical protein TIFTF001_003431 [Ficus carica]|uniref:Late embryogenesis abundant protein LEA-2 subgroup domain-containing protein n=1 Tax=Ficus carica TaxID=3494 RepID=A0AA87ZRR9_FICCA|nr:hypothetical protein TIFTF001_003431 [Ficus carica]
MADYQKNQQEYHFAPANRHHRSDAESNTLYSNELKRKKRIKLAIYIAAFAVFQGIVITIFALTVMRVKSPKLRLGNNIRFQNLTTGTEQSPSFDMSFAAQVRVKNPNFGPYKFHDTTATFAYDGVTVGEVLILKSKAGLKSTKKIDVAVNLSSSALQSSSTSKLGNELSGGALTLTSTAKMSGKVELMLMMKKKKSAEMNCIITVDVSANAVRSLQCK